jgi:hypothetical protein
LKRWRYAPVFPCPVTIAVNTGIISVLNFGSYLASQSCVYPTGYRLPCFTVLCLPYRIPATLLHSPVSTLQDTSYLAWQSCVYHTGYHLPYFTVLCLPYRVCAVCGSAGNGRVVWCGAGNGGLIVKVEMWYITAVFITTTTCTTVALNPALPTGHFTFSVHRLVDMRSTVQYCAGLSRSVHTVTWCKKFFTKI